MVQTAKPAWWLVAFIVILLNYITFSKVSIIWYYLYGLIVILAIIVHIFVIKNFNVKIITITKNYYDPLKLIIKLFISQATVLLLTVWVIINLLNQGELNIRTTTISNNLIVDNYILSVASWINWLILISLLLGINYCKSYFKYPANWNTIAKCLVPTVGQQPWLSCYRMLLHVEIYSRIISLLTIFVVIANIYFEIVVNKYKLFSFFQYPMTTFFLTITTFSYLIKKIWNNIDFCIQKTSIDFLTIFIMSVLIGSIIAFILNQLVLEKIHLLNAVHNYPNIFIGKYFSNDLNQYRIKLLLLSINILFSVSSASLLLKNISNYQINNIYFMSIIFPAACSFLCYKFTDIYKYINISSVKDINIFMSLFIILILIINYKNIYNFNGIINGASIIKSCKIKKMKTSFNWFIKKIIYGYFCYLSLYYLSAWVLPMQMLVLACVFLLPGLIFLYFKTLLKY